jgi:hypothetical protein
MKSCLFVLAFTCVAMWGQDYTVGVFHKPGADQVKAFGDALQRPLERGLDMAQHSLPERKIVIVPNPGLLAMPRPFEHKFDLARQVVSSGNFIFVPNAGVPEIVPTSDICVVPLLAAPIDSNAGRTMPVLRPRKSRPDNAETVKGLPPCASPTEK